MPEYTMIVYLFDTNAEYFVVILYPNLVWFEIYLQRDRQFPFSVRCLILDNSNYVA